MSVAFDRASGREDFAALLEESFQRSNAIEGGVVEGIVVAIEKDVAVIDVGLKTEGRVPLKEFQPNVKDGGLKIGDKVEVYLDRIEKEAILEALEKTRYNRTAAAKLLGITFRAMRYRMERLGIK